MVIELYALWGSDRDLSLHDKTPCGKDNLYDKYCAMRKDYAVVVVAI